MVVACPVVVLPPPEQSMLMGYGISCPAPVLPDTNHLWVSTALVEDVFHRLWRLSTDDAGAMKVNYGSASRRWPIPVCCVPLWVGPGVYPLCDGSIRRQGPHQGPRQEALAEGPHRLRCPRGNPGREGIVRVLQPCVHSPCPRFTSRYRRSQEASLNRSFQDRLQWLARYRLSHWGWKRPHFPHPCFPWRLVLCS
jgi:hypothetical protein